MKFTTDNFSIDKAKFYDHHDVHKKIMFNQKLSIVNFSIECQRQKLLFSFVKKPSKRF